MRLTYISAIATFLCLATAVTDADAIEVKDQFHDVPASLDPEGPVDTIASKGQAPWQTFEVGVSGILSQVDLGVYQLVDQHLSLTVQITRAANNIADLKASSVLATAIIPADLVPTIAPFEPRIPHNTLSVDFSASQLAVQKGDSLAIVLRSEGNQYYGVYWWNNYWGHPDQYSRGDSSLWGDNADAQFATFVQVPEPTGLCLTAVILAISHAIHNRAGVKPYQQRLFITDLYPGV
jgi:hypothetical protein